MNDYDFEIDVFVGGGVDLIFKTYVGEQIKNKKMIKKEKDFLGLILFRWDSVFIINRKPSPWK